VSRATANRGSTRAADLPLNSTAGIEIDFGMTDQTRSPWDESGMPPACLAWVTEVDRLMLAEFCIDMSDAGADRDQIVRYWEWARTPADFVEWFGEKYDLITRDQRDPFGVARGSRRE
jgi:hypothetical protein